MNIAFIKYIVALFLFGLNGIVVSYISLNPYETVFTRTLIGSLFIVIIYFFSKNKLQLLKNKNHVLYIIISGITLGASWLLLFKAYILSGVCIATLTYYCGPIIVMIFSIFIFNEQLSFGRIIGFIGVIIGMFLLSEQNISQGGNFDGFTYGILAAIMYSIMVIFNKKVDSITGLENAMWQLLISFITVALFLVIKQGLFINMRLSNLVPVLFLGIFNTGIACYCYFSSIGELPAQTVAIFGYLEPLLALIFSTIFLGELLSFLQLIGAALILGGAAFGEFYKMKNYV